VADITLGDYSDIEKAHPGFSSSQGASVVMINTEKGELLFRQVHDDFEITGSTLENAYQWHLHKPSPRHVLRDVAYMDINSEGFDIYRDVAFRLNIKTVIFGCAKRVLPSGFIKFLLRVNARIKPDG